MPIEPDKYKTVIPWWHTDSGIHPEPQPVVEQPTERRDTLLIGSGPQVFVNPLALHPSADGPADAITVGGPNVQ
jgi:hypothetical protein